MPHHARIRAHLEHLHRLSELFYRFLNNYSWSSSTPGTDEGLTAPRRCVRYLVSHVAPAHRQAGTRRPHPYHHLRHVHAAPVPSSPPGLRCLAAARATFPSNARTSRWSLRLTMRAKA